MKIKLLLDENLPRPLKNDFSEKFDVTTVPDEGWANLKNGELLSAMTEAGIEFLLTADKNLQHQQNLKKHGVKVVVVRTFDTRYKTLKPHVEKIEEEILNMAEDADVLEVDVRGKML